MPNNSPNLSSLEQAVLIQLSKGPKTMRDLRAFVSGTRDQIADAVLQLHTRGIIRKKKDSIPAIWYLSEVKR